MEHKGFNAVRDFAYRPDARRDPYGLEAALSGLEGQARAEAERYVFDLWKMPGWTLERLKKVHAYGIAMTRPLSAFEPGRYALHAYDGGDYFTDDEIITESLAPLDLEQVAKDLDTDVAQLREMAPEELADYLRDEELCGDAPRLLEADSMEALLDAMLQHDAFVWGIDEDPFDDEALDDAGRYSDNYYEPFKAILDMDLRSKALAINGNIQLMELLYDEERVFYCPGLTYRRPGWCFVCAWDAVPHRQEEGWAILFHPCGQ